MKLITEVNEDIKQVVTEDKESGTKKYFIEGVFMQGDMKNRNNRIYPMGTLDKEAKRYNESYIQKNRAYGELGHPQGPTINLERVSHMIKELKQDGSNYVGRAKITDTPYGNIVKNLIDEGASLGVSSRGMGTLKQQRDGTQQVQDDFYLATAADIVADPSAPDAYVNGVMEGKEWVWSNGIIQEKDVAAQQRYIQKSSRRDLEQSKLNVFKNFVSKL
jgi:hypothetical protein